MRPRRRKRCVWITIRYHRCRRWAIPGSLWCTPHRLKVVGKACDEVLKRRIPPGYPGHDAR